VASVPSAGAWDGADAPDPPAAAGREQTDARQRRRPRADAAGERAGRPGEERDHEGAGREGEAGLKDGVAPDPGQEKHARQQQPEEGHREAPAR
jgi:hypothetical protein